MSIVNRDIDEELTTELLSQDGSHSNSETITGRMTSDVTMVPAVGSQANSTMVTEGNQECRQPQSHSAGRFVLESDHLALKNNSEYVYFLLLF